MDEILNLIESVSEDFPFYSINTHIINILSFFNVSYRHYLFNSYMVIQYTETTTVYENTFKKDNFKIKNNDHLHNVEHVIQTIFQNV